MRDVGVYVSPKNFIWLGLSVMICAYFSAYTKQEDHSTTKLKLSLFDILLYIHGKQLMSCRDGNHSVPWQASPGGRLPAFSANSFAIYRQYTLLESAEERLTNFPRKNVPDAKVDLGTACIRGAIDKFAEFSSH